jgi:hypothetical protein
MFYCARLRPTVKTHGNGSITATRLWSANKREQQRRLAQNRPIETERKSALCSHRNGFTRAMPIKPSTAFQHSRHEAALPAPAPHGLIQQRRAAIEASPGDHEPKNAIRTDGGRKSIANPYADTASAPQTPAKSRTPPANFLENLEKCQTLKIPRTILLSRSLDGPTHSEKLRIRNPRRWRDRISGLANGAVAKIIGPRPAKKLGITSLGAVLQTLGLILVVVEDPVARDKTLARRTPFNASNRRVGLLKLAIWQTL